MQPRGATGQAPHEPARSLAGRSQVFIKSTVSAWPTESASEDTLGTRCVAGLAEVAERA